MPDGSNVTTTTQKWDELAIAIKADRVLALVAALDLLADNEGSFEDQDKIRFNLTAIAYEEARELTRLMAA